MKTFISTTMTLMVFVSSCPVWENPVAYGDRQQQQLQLKNVRLSANGRLIGQYVTHVGLPVANAEIVIQTGKAVHRPVTDERGLFAVDGLKGGRCVIQADGEVFACQLWAYGTAPPQSIHRVAVVAPETSHVRGNRFWPPPFIPVPEKLAALSRRQVIIGGLLIAGATAGVIIAADDDDDNAS